METAKLCTFCLGAINDDNFIDLGKDGSEETNKTREKLKELLTEDVSFRVLLVFYLF